MIVWFLKYLVSPFTIMLIIIAIRDSIRYTAAVVFLSLDFNDTFDISRGLDEVDLVAF